MLEELAYRGLAEGKLPKVPNTKGPPELALARLGAVARAAALSANAARLAAARGFAKTVRITDARLEGFRAVYSNACLVRSGDRLTFKATFRYEGLKPETVLCSVSAGDQRRDALVLFPPRSEYELAVDVPVADPAYLRCSATSRPGPGGPARYVVDYLREANSVSQTYPVGVLDERLKPVSEYPVSGADNAVLDVPYAWSTGCDVYPADAPPGLVFDSLAAHYYYGFLVFDGRHYRDPATNNTVRLSAGLANNTGYDLTVASYGLVVGVLYEDGRHVSQAAVDASFPQRTLTRGSRLQCQLDVNLPPWAYGRVAIAHALAFYRGSTLWWVGGPFCRLEAYRLRLP